MVWRVSLQSETENSFLVSNAALSPLYFQIARRYKLTRTYNSEIYMPKKRRRVAWSADHVRTLKSMAKKKRPAGEIAKALKRTEGATRQKAFSMGLSLDTRG